VIDRNFILSAVGESLNTLVVLLTEKMLGQAWCARKVTTAVRKNPVVVLLIADSMVDFGIFRKGSFRYWTSSLMTFTYVGVGSRDQCYKNHLGKF
jgi:hypothetical protein